MTRALLIFGLPVALLLLLPGGVSGWVLLSGVVVSGLFFGLVRG